MKRFHHKSTLPLILTLLVVAIAILTVGFFNYRRQTTLPSDSDTTALGVELNQNFNFVDLHKLQANGISFVYLRGTQGRSYFDNNYLLYRDQVQGTRLAFGTILSYSNQSTPQEQYNYFMKKIGLNCGSLPILITPAVNLRTAKFLKEMALLAMMLEEQDKPVMIGLNYKYHSFFPAGTKFLASGSQQPNKMHYAFWLYTNNGRVKNVTGLEKGVTMFSYNGTVGQYKQKYGQLTQ